ncbi:RNase iii [Stagonosporopsis vannaccii]|nr:RNase iii [Stagonosporopsis vannaccii]
MNVLSKLAHVEQAIRRAFRNQLVGIEALNADRASIYHGQQHHILRRNDDLAIVGDKAFEVVLTVLWYRAKDSEAGRSLAKGDWTRIQQGLVSEAALAARGFDLGLDACVIKNPGHTSCISNRMMATALEAIIGAVFEDSDYDLEAVRAVMQNLGFFEHELLQHTDCTSLRILPDPLNGA